MLYARRRTETYNVCW